MKQQPTIVRENLERTVKHETTVIEKFQAQLTVDAAYALSWSGDVFDSAARLYVAKNALLTLTYGHSPDDALSVEDVERLAETALHLALQGASMPRRSTSVADNLMNQAITVAWAKLAESLR